MLALVFDSSHEKSRFRSAKACLEIGMYDRFEASSRGDKSLTGVPFLVQAKHDLEVILQKDPTHDYWRAAQIVGHKVEKLLEGVKKKSLGQWSRKRMGYDGSQNPIDVVVVPKEK